MSEESTLERLPEDRTIIVKMPARLVPPLIEVTEAAATWFAGRPPIFVVPEDGFALVVCSPERGIAAVIRHPEIEVYISNGARRPLALSLPDDAWEACLSEPLTYYDVNRVALEVDPPPDQAPGTFVALSLGKAAHHRDSWHVGPEQQPEWADEVTLAHGDCTISEDHPEVAAAPKWLEILDRRRAEPVQAVERVSFDTRYLGLLQAFGSAAVLEFHGSEGNAVVRFPDSPDDSYVALMPLDPHEPVRREGLDG